MTKSKSVASEYHCVHVSFHEPIIEVFCRSTRNGRQYDEDLIISEREGGRRRREDDHVSRRRSVSHDARSHAAYSTRDDRDIAEEAEYYNSRAQERSYLGEGYNGANRDWAIVDVPPGTRRVQMEGIGGAKEEITWQRYNGVRRSKFIAEDEEYRGGGELMAPREVESLDRGRRFVGEKDRKEKMWTEITKDLVTKEAIEKMGYDYEETEFFYYIMVYLRYVSPSSHFTRCFQFFAILASHQTYASRADLIRTGGRPQPRRALRRPQARPPRTDPRNRMGALGPASQAPTRASRQTMGGRTHRGARSHLRWAAAKTIPMNNHG